MGYFGRFLQTIFFNLVYHNIVEKCGWHFFGSHLYRIVEIVIIGNTFSMEHELRLHGMRLKRGCHLFRCNTCVTWVPYDLALDHTLSEKFKMAPKVTVLCKILGGWRD